MKNFFKKLSFVLAIAMVLTTVAPATASAATAEIVKKGKAHATTVYVYAGGSKVNLDFTGNGKGGAWSSSDEKIVKVDKNGVLTPVANGKAVITFTTAKNKTYKQAVTVRTRATGINIYKQAEYEAGNKNKLNNTTVEVKAGTETGIRLTLPVSAKAKALGITSSTYKTYVESSNPEVAELVRVSGQRTFTLNAKTAGEATITISAKNSKSATTYVKTATFKVNVEEKATVAAKPSKANEVEVTFNKPASEDMTIAISRGTYAVVGTTTWNADRTVATVKTTANLVKGEHVVAVSGTSIKDEAKFVVEDQRVDKIEFTDGVALLSDDQKEAYVYYTVLDQYGVDITASTSLQWSSSCEIKEKNTLLGRITVQKKDSSVFMYNEQIFMNAVHIKTSTTLSDSLTVGAKQALDNVELAGFIAVRDNKLVQELPANFIAGEYYLAYDAYDQNGNLLEANVYDTTDYVQFTSRNVMIVKDIKLDARKTMTVDGHTYRVAAVTPGDYVGQGGEVYVQVIALKTGKASEHVYSVGAGRIIKSFEMQVPSGIVADGETVTIPFKAYDTNGNEMTAFKAIADNVDALHELTLSVSTGFNIKLSEQQDGTAKLTLEDTARATWNADCTDGVDRPATITAVVVGGESSNITVYFSDKARPVAIDSIVGMDEVLVEEGSTMTGLTSMNKSLAYPGMKYFTYIDQYGRKLMDVSSVTKTDNGFFDYADGSNSLNGVDFNGWKFSVTATKAAISDDTIELTGNATIGWIVTASKTAVSTVKSGNVVKFAIEKTKAAETETVSPIYLKDITVVDIKQVKNFEVGALNLQYVKTNLSDYANGYVANLAGNNPSKNLSTVSFGAIASGSAEIDEDYKQDLSVSGYFGSTKVAIPDSYVTYSTELGKLTVSGSSIDGASKAAIKVAELYDLNTPQFSRKNSSDVVKATIKDVNTEATSTTAIAVATRTVAFSDAAPYFADLAITSVTKNPTNSDLTVTVTAAAKNQYGKDIETVSYRYRVSDIVEAEGFVSGNFTVLGNDTSSLEIKGAELGDKFTLTVIATSGDVTKTATYDVTIGVDTNASIINNTNNYIKAAGLKPALIVQKSNLSK